MIEIFRAQQVLQDENATDAERAAAALTIQREQGESILRGIEISELGWLTGDDQGNPDRHGGHYQSRGRGRSLW